MTDTDVKTNKTKARAGTTKPFNLLSRITINQVEIIEQLIHQICKDFPQVEGKDEEMITKYLHKEEKLWKKMVKKCKPKKPRSKSGYTIFLSDPVVIEEIKKDNKDVMMKNLNPFKGRKWKSIKMQQPALYKRYSMVAQLFKYDLIEYNDADQDQIREIIKMWMYDKSIGELEKMLKKIPQEPKSKKQKSSTKKTVKKKSESKSESESESESGSESESESELESESESGSESEEEKPKLKKKRIVDSDTDESEQEFDLSKTQAYDD